MNSLFGTPMLWVLIGVGTFAALVVVGLVWWALSLRSKGKVPHDAPPTDRAS